MLLQGKVVEPQSDTGVPGVVINLLLPAKEQPASAAIEFRGNRHLCLGTTHTNARGEFSLGLEQLDLGKARCVQAIVMVETPRLLIDADPTDEADGRGTLLQAMQLTLGPAGATALSVPVSATRLREAGVELGGHAQSSAAMLQMAWRDQDASLKLVAPVARPRFDGKLALRQTAKARVGSLSRLPPSLRDSGLVASEGEVGAAHAKAKELSQKRLGRYAEAPRSVARLWATEFELGRRLGVDLGGTTFPFAITGSVCELVNAKTGPSLQRIRGLLDEALPEPGESDPGSGEDPSEEEEEEGTDLDELETSELLELATRQRISSLISLEDELQPLDGLRRLSDSLSDFRIPGGPTDEVALHDFFSLQIAFENVWVEAFDGGLRSEAEALYALVAELHEEYGVDSSWMGDIDDLQALEAFLDESDRRRRSFPLTEPPVEVLQFWPGISLLEWNALSCQQQTLLKLTAAAADTARREAQRERLVADGQRIISTPQGRLLRVQELILSLRSKRGEAHAFHYFAPNSVNYGILLNYRQRWVPQAYQVGQLVSTIPLAPSESRRIKVEEKVARSRAETERRSSLRAFKDDSNESRRADSEIVRRARMATNFQQTVQGSLNFGIGQIGSTSVFGLNQANESARTKRDFRQSVRSASQEFRNQRQLEVKTTENSEETSERVQELSNPNDEITVTYLMYELERRYHVSESLHRLTPVVMVAQDIPAPHEIDDGWLIANEWILRRVLLDDRFTKALDLLTDGFVSDEVSVSVARQAWEVQTGVVDTLKSNYSAVQSAHESLQQRLVDTMMDQADAAAGEPDEVSVAAAAFATGGWSLLFGEGDAGSERFEAMRKALELRLEQLDKKLGQAKADLRAEASVLEKAQATYTKALQDQFERRTLVDQLRVHVKDNILHYMQALWDHEPPDQRFFRLYHVKVPVPNPAPGACTLRRATPEEIAEGNVVRRGGDLWVVSCAAPSLDDVEERPLGEIADLDRPLGFKGNYLIFALKECVYLTDFMMQEYVDDYLGIRDPDVLGEFSTTELVELRRRHGASMAPEDRSLLDRIVSQRLSGPSAEEEEIIVPTGQLMMEVLPGAHPVLEHFKRVHRMVDLGKAENEARMDELETLRYAARLSSGDFVDPEIDRHIVVDGGDVTVRTDT